MEDKLNVLINAQLSLSFFNLLETFLGLAHFAWKHQWFENDHGMLKDLK
jgi:hypothetical protein